MEFTEFEKKGSPHGRCQRVKDVLLVVVVLLLLLQTGFNIWLWQSNMIGMNLVEDRPTAHSIHVRATMQNPLWLYKS